MKNQFKAGVLAAMIVLSASACSGDRSKHSSDTTKKDNVITDTAGKGQKPGANGSSLGIDSGMDKSGSGGTDTSKRPSDITTKK